MEKREIIDKYVQIYHKRNIQLSIFCATLVFIPLFVVSLFYDVVPEDTLISFFPFVLATISVGIASLFTIRFKRTIKRQEKIYKVEFNDENVVHLETTLYLSKEWLIWAGSFAIYKKNIKSLNSIRRYGRAGSSNEVIIKGVDGEKFKFWCKSSSNVKRIRKWINSNL